MAIKASDFVPDKIKTSYKSVKQAFQTFVKFEVEVAKTHAQLMTMNFTGGFISNHQTVRGVKSNLRSIEKLGKKLDAAGPVLTDKDYKDRFDTYGLIATKHAEDAKTHLDKFDKMLSEAETATKTKFGVLQKKSAEVRRQIETSSNDAKADQSRLQSWWRTLSQDGMTALPIDSKLTDILEKTPKNLDIAMPPKQHFSANVKFKNVPKFVESDFRSDGSKILQKHAKVMLGDVKTAVSKELGKFNASFQIADRKSDNKRASAIFDNLNDYLKNDIKPMLEQALEVAAEETVAEMRKVKKQLYRPLFDKTGTEVGKIEVDTSGFFSVEFVEKADPSAALVSGFKDASKSLEKHHSAYESATKDLSKNLTTVDDSLGELARSIGTLEKDLKGVTEDKEFVTVIKANSSKREGFLSQIGAANKGIPKQAETITSSLTTLSKTLTTVSADFEKKSDDVKENVNVSKKLVENFRAAVKVLQGAIAKAQKFNAPELKWENHRGGLAKHLEAGNIRKAKFKAEELRSALGGQQKTVAELQGKIKDTPVDISKEYEALEKAAAALA